MILDATALLLLINNKIEPPKNKGTKEPITDAHKRVAALVEEVTGRGEKIIIATPVLAELLVGIEDATPFIEEFSSSSRFRIVNFDQKAAIEHSIYTRKALQQGDKRGGIEESWCKVKFDRQIVAIAKAVGAHTICTDDEGLTKHAQQQGINVIGIADLKLNEQMTIDSLIEMQEAQAAEALPISEVTTTAQETDGNNAAPALAAPTPENTKGEAIVEIAPPPLKPDSPTEVSGI